ncbi:MAG: CoA pyrophosphatase, partial [Chloroflexi bacterium]
MIRATISENLRSFERRESPRSLAPAAVAIVLVTMDGIPSVPMFQRPLNMSRHAGQMALPGGRVHAGETVEECAIREVYEELGLVLDRADVLGLLDDFDTQSGFTITPVVIWSAADVSDLKPSKDEVLKVFVTGVPEIRETVAVAALGSTQEFSLRFRRVEVFAPTAAILFQFSEVALDGR